MKQFGRWLCRYYNVIRCFTSNLREKLIIMFMLQDDAVLGREAAAVIAAIAGGAS